MKKTLTLLVALLIFVLFCACRQTENTLTGNALLPASSEIEGRMPEKKTPPAVDPFEKPEKKEAVSQNDIGNFAHASDEKSGVEQGDEEALKYLSDLLVPVNDGTNYMLLGYVRDFFSIAVPASLSAKPDDSLEDLVEIQSRILSVTEPIIQAVVPQGYAVQELWAQLSDSCSAINRNIEESMQALADQDASTVMDRKESCSQTDLLERAIAVQNVLANERSNLEQQEEKNAIEVAVDDAEWKEKALRYARYYFERDEITELARSDETVTFEDIPGKYVVFTVPGEDDVWILINVEDGSIVNRVRISDGFRYQFVNDADLPAQDGDIKMPDVVGMPPEDAVQLIQEMGFACEIAGSYETDCVDPGLVCRSYPGEGSALVQGTTVLLFTALESYE